MPTGKTEPGREEAHPVPQSAMLPSLYAVFATAAAVLVADQVTKQMAVGLRARSPVSLFGGAVFLDYTRNSGAAFSILQARTPILIAVACAVIVVIGFALRRIADSSLMVRLAAGFILGGATGNLLDRIRLGYVVDFIDLRWWPVFNLADSAVVCGVGLLLLASVSQERRGVRG